MSFRIIDLNSYEAPGGDFSDTGVKAPRILTMAGSDSSGGAGIEADLKTITVHGCYGLTCINSLTAQNTQGVQDAFELPFDFIVKMLESNMADIDVDVIKTGMLSENGIKALIQAVGKFDYKGGLVIDPVMVSTSGFELSKRTNLKLIVEGLFPRATLVTPNIVEAKTIMSLVSTDEFQSESAAYGYYQDLEITSADQIMEFCRTIVAKTGVENILIKGGHARYGEGDVLNDILYESRSERFTVFKSKFQDSKSTHGTGCTLASAIASNLGKKLDLLDSVGNAIIYVQNAIRKADVSIGHGNGPLNHYEVHQPVKFQSVDFNGGDLMEYLKSHQFVRKDWDRYVHHPFIKRLAQLELPIESFFGYLKQDHAYLLNYAKTHCLAAAVAPNAQELEKEVEILQNIITEMHKHRDKLLKLGIPESDLNKVQLTKQCQEYSDYLFKIARTGTWLEINIAMSACLFGYREAAQYGNSLYVHREDSLKDTLYKEWLDDYCAEWYHTACLDGEAVIKNCKFDSKDLPQLLEIFGNVVKLEIQFWNAFL